MLTARLIVHTQYRENYGAHDWNGEGACPQHWKCKGEIDYHVADVTVEEALRGEAYLDSIVQASLSRVEKSDDFTQVTTRDWQLYWMGEFTQDEKDQEEYRKQGWPTGGPAVEDRREKAA